MRKANGPCSSRRSLCEYRIYGCHACVRGVGLLKNRALSVYLTFYLTTAKDRITRQSQIDQITENRRKTVEAALPGSAEKGFDFRSLQRRKRHLPQYGGRVSVGRGRNSANIIGTGRSKGRPVPLLLLSGGCGSRGRR